MLFNSVKFGIFFPIVTLTYFLAPQKWRWFVLVIASCYFYMAFIPKYLLILFVLILVDYFAGIAIESANLKTKKLLLVVSLCVNIGMLAIFKYFNFFVVNFSGLMAFMGWNYSIETLSWVLPIGLSFHTFQSMSYTIEVYRGNQKAERHLGYYALYVLFYPQLVAGPIERPQNLLHQFREPHSFRIDHMITGLRWMGVGLFKKVVIADTLAMIVNRVYGNPSAYSSTALLFATYCFSFQIYCDFSGYSDIAIGAAKCMGFRLMKNFDHPYSSQSISEFWRRWHISLSSWFRDYLYIPLGGNRGSTGRRYFNLFFVFLVSGFWHGANWTYLAWGAIHGSYLILGHVSQGLMEKLTHGLRLNRLRSMLGVFLTFNLVSFAWIFFRATSLPEALLVIKKVFYWPSWHALKLLTISIELKLVVLATCLIFLLELSHFAYRNDRIWDRIFRNRPYWVRWGYYYGAILIFFVTILLRGTPLKSQQFIYYQF